MTKVPVSAIITTCNEVEFIEDCVRSVDWADEICLIDSFSTDGTVELICEKFPNIRLEQRTYFGSASQKNFGIDLAAHDWVFIIDADERVTPPLRREILQTLDEPLDRWAYSVGRLNFMLGNKLRYSGLQRDRVTRLFHRKHARYPNRRVHTDLAVDGPIGRLAERMDHLYIRSFDHMIVKMTRYGNWGAAQLFLDGKTASLWEIFSHPLGKFIRDYVLNLGFLDGTAGMISVGMHVYYTFWKYARLWELTQLKRTGKPLRLPPLDEEQERWQMPWEKTSGSAS
jgi:glycosyltransferase involved in cell wall biosynthesis